MKIRDSNLEILRIISIFLILMLHTAALSKSEDIFSINAIVTRVISSFGNVGVTCFILISGYFGIKFKLDRFLYLVYLTSFYSLIVYLTNSFFYNHPLSYKLILENLFIVPLYKNWFITCYLIVFLISEYIDIFCSCLDRKTFRNLLIVLTVLFSFIPTIFNNPYYTVLYGGGKCLSYFLFLYIVGRYIQKYSIEVKNIKRLILIFTGNIVTMNVLNNVASYFLKKNIVIYSMDCSPFILVNALILFLIFSNRKSYHSRIINYFSSSVVAVYLLDGARLSIDKWTVNLGSLKGSEITIWYIILEVIIAFVIFMFFDKLRVYFLAKLEFLIINNVSRIILGIQQKLKLYNDKLLNSNKYL
ncbi:acyltransferase family protein [Cellulophaga sp. BC115SP]|uniref:acyltransferase family protein n=1 Tax=Cellulophaga sp. BC115SP TaxID=2683263 RepID=UPI001412D27E|nr:acyltransferase family protein [Cellulophaga sp. BC115SP]